MIPSEMAKYRTDDMLRGAEGFRRTRETRSARTHARNESVKRIARTALTALAWPIRH